MGRFSKWPHDRRREQGILHGGSGEEEMVHAFSRWDIAKQGGEGHMSSLEKYILNYKLSIIPVQDLSSLIGRILRAF